MITYIIQNALYIPFLIYILKDKYDVFLLTILGLKLYKTNYYICFGKYYPEYSYPIMKSIVHLTDTGFIASVMYSVNSNTIALAYNVHGIITIMYWIIVLSVDSSTIDTDSLVIKELNKTYEYIYIKLNHGLVFIWLITRLYTGNECTNYFTHNNLINTYIWVYGWVIFIYIPWRLLTGDVVYNLFSNKTPLKHQILAVIVTNILIYVLNVSGRLIESNVCGLIN